MSATLSATFLAPSALPEELPIFPLAGVVLLPRARLPLNVFEQRYLTMVEDALASPGRMIGMIQPNTHEHNDDPVPPIYKIGCAGRIVSFSEAENNRFLISLSGVCRFEVAEELPRDKLYRRVRPDWSRFHNDLAMPKPVDIPRQQMMKVLHDYFHQQNIDTDWKIIEKTPDELLISSLTMICPFAPNERQALLEATDLEARAKMLTALLEMGLLPQGGEGESGARH